MTNKIIRTVEREINYKGVIYVMCPCLDIKKAAQAKESLGFKTLCATMTLHPSLRGRTDLHGQPYKGSQFLYVSKTNYRQ